MDDDLCAKTYDFAVPSPDLADLPEQSLFGFDAQQTLLEGCDLEQYLAKVDPEELFPISSKNDPEETLVSTVKLCELQDSLAVENFVKNCWSDLDPATDVSHGQWLNFDCDLSSVESLLTCPTTDGPKACSDAEAAVASDAEGSNIGNEVVYTSLERAPIAAAGGASFTLEGGPAQALLNRRLSSAGASDDSPSSDHVAVDPCSSLSPVSVRTPLSEAADDETLDEESCSCGSLSSISLDHCFSAAPCNAAEPKRIRGSKKVEQSVHRLQKKRIQNRAAAMRYRLKKKSEKVELGIELDRLTKRNEELREQIATVGNSIKYVTMFLSKLDRNNKASTVRKAAASCLSSH